MKRRSFVVASGSVVFSPTVFDSVQKPALGLEFEVSSVPNRKGNNVSSVLIDFSRFKLRAKYVEESENLDVNVELTVDGNSNGFQKSIKISNKGVVDTSDIKEETPILVTGIDTTQESVDGRVVIEISHPSIGSKNYQRSFNISDNTLLNDLKSYYPMEKGNGDILHDGVSSNIGRLKQVSWNSNGKVGSRCLSFDGTGYVALPNYPNLSGSFSISAWIKTNDNSQAGQRVFADDESNTGGYALSVGDGGTGVVRFYMRNKDSDSLDSESSINSNTWYHVVAVHNADKAERYLYINGSRDNGTKDNKGDVGVDNGTATIGGETDSGESDNRFNGLIDDIRVYDRVLTSSEVTSLYNLSDPTGSLVKDSDVPNNTNGGVARYDLNGDVKNSWGDNSPAINGDPSFVDGIYGNCLLFDGSSDEVDTNSLGPYDNSGWTISAWFKTSSSGKQPVIGNYDGSFPQVKLIVDESGNGKVSLRLRDSTATDIQVYSSTTVNDGDWYHAVGRRKNGNGEVFVNGGFESREGDGTDEVDLRSGNVHIGSRADGANRFVGKIDDVRLYNRSLTDEEIKKLFNLGAYRV